MKSMQRVLRYDGLLPAVMDNTGKWHDTTPDDIRAMRAFVEANRVETTPFDIVMEGKTPGNDREQACAIVKPWADAGATWWIEAMWDVIDKPDRLTTVRERITQGPPRID